MKGCPGRVPHLNAHQLSMMVPFDCFCFFLSSNSFPCLVSSYLWLLQALFYFWNCVCPTNFPRCFCVVPPFLPSMKFPRDFSFPPCYLFLFYNPPMNRLELFVEPTEDHKGWQWPPQKFKLYDIFSPCGNLLAVNDMIWLYCGPLLLNHFDYISSCSFLSLFEC